jgi:hypothetical protein
MLAGVVAVSATKRTTRHPAFRERSHTKNNNMNRIKVRTLGFDLTKEVPASVEEYNSLAPKRENPVLDDAVSNVLYRCTFAQFRTALLDKLEELTGIARINRGTEDEPEWESDAKFMKRLQASPADKSSWPTIAQECMDAAEFNVAERESTGTPKQKVGKKDLASAQEAIDKGLAEKLASMLGTYLERNVGTDVKSLAEGLKDRRAKLVEIAEKEQAELLTV